MSSLRTDDLAPSTLPKASRNSPRLVAPIDLEKSLPEHLPIPKFQIGQKVLWANVGTHGFGRIIGLVFAGGISVKASGFHYLVFFSADSPSRTDCPADWAFEDDLELLETHAHLLQTETRL